MSTSDRKDGFSFGNLAWLGLIIYVTTYDIIALRKNVTTLSTAFYKLSRRRYSSPFVIVLWAVLTGHLFRLLPKKFDPFRSWL